MLKDSAGLHVGKDRRLVVDVLNLDGKLGFGHEVRAVTDLQRQRVLVHLFVDQGLGQVDVADFGIIRTLHSSEGSVLVGLFRSAVDELEEDRFVVGNV